VSFSQTQSEEKPHEEGNYVIGLPLMTQVQLEFIKNDLLEMSQLTSAEFVWGDNCLLLESDPNVKRMLTYAEIESLLLKYFNKKDIYPKEVSSFKEVQIHNSKADKYIIK
jgi:hypothetical protein